MADAVIAILAAHPWIIYVYTGAVIAAVALRAAWDVTEERPRWVRALLAVTDLLQLNLSGPAKLLANKAKSGEPRP